MNSGLAADGKAVVRRRRGIARSLLAVMALLLALVLTVVAARTAWVRHVERGHDRKQKLEEIHLAFKMYANESKGEKYPPMASGDAAFRLDLDTLNSSFTFSDQNLLDYLAGGTGVDVCYLGHLVVSDSAAQVLLDEYADKGIDRVRDSQIELDHAFFHGRAWYPTRTLWRLGEGAERVIYQAFCDPSATDKARALIPVLWELPDEADPRTRHGGWVLYANGKAEWKPYPGEFPMTEEFVRRLRDMMDTPPAKWKNARKRLAKEYPEAARICEAIRPLQETRFLYGDPVVLSWAIAHFDSQPTVEVDGHRGYRVVLRNESLKWNDMNRTRLDPQALIELVAFPSDDDLPAGLEQRIPWNWPRKDDQACAVDLGQGAGYRWFGRAAPPWLGFVQERLALAGGSDYLNELVAWLGRNDDFETHRLALGAVSRHGAAALSFLEQEIEHPSVFAGKDGFRAEELTRTLELMPGTRAGELLASLYFSGDEEVNRRAGWALVDRPRPEGKAVYVDLLRRNKYSGGGYPIQYFKELARAAAQFGGPEARPLLQELCTHSNEFVASQARVALEGWPIPEGLVNVLAETRDREPAHETANQANGPMFAIYRQGDLGAGACLDFDTGRLFLVPISVAIAEDPAVTRGWLRDNGVDAVIERTPQRRTLSLLWLDFRKLSADDQGWERSASDALASLQRAQRAPVDMREEVERPIVRLFETHEGACGVFRGEVGEKDTGSKGGPEPSFRLSYKLMEGGSAERSGVMPDTATDTYNETPMPSTDQHLIGAARQAILTYARAHENRWPDSLEDVLAGEYLKVPDSPAFLAQFEYVKPWISLEELEGWGIFARTPELSDYQTVLVVRRKQDNSDNWPRDGSQEGAEGSQTLDHLDLMDAMASIKAEGPSGVHTVHKVHIVHHLGGICASPMLSLGSNAPKILVCACLGTHEHKHEEVRRVGHTPP